MAKHLVIVESPAKAKSINNYLGNDFKVMASYGHVRDLRAKEGAVDPEQDFAMTYEVIDRNKKHVDAISSELEKAEDLYLATDPDREGEAIAWHLVQLLREQGHLDGKGVYRVVFHEITKNAVREAMEQPRDISEYLVNAQQARRALDYLVGFNLSPLLWKKVRRGLSAGRVQSPALRLIAEREEEIENFEPTEYWSVEADLGAPNEQGVATVFTANLVEAEGKKLEKLSVGDGERAEELRARVEAAASDGTLPVTSVEKKQSKRNPTPPFTTSTLQQEASRKLGFSVSRTMRVAQQLYEGMDLGEGTVGLITYMRTDSVNLSEEAVSEARTLIDERYGQDFLPDKPRHFKSQSKNAQEAHEAIRPTSPARHPEQVKDKLDKDQFRLYELVWKRMVAGQMTPALVDNVTAHFEIEPGWRLKATGSTIAFPGFLKVYEEGKDDATGDTKESKLPPLAEGDTPELQQARAEQHFTQPPPRYTEATLVKQLESYGIGRPSTYASILSTLQDRGYAELDNKRFFLTDVGRVVNRFLTNHFTTYVDYDFTARLEDELDAVSRGEEDWRPVLREFWEPFHKQVAEKEETVSRAEVTSEAMEEACPKCGANLEKKLGRHGQFIGCSAYPECDYTRPVEGEAEEPEETDRSCPKCERPLAIKRGRYGKFLGCTGYPECKYLEPLEKPKGTGVTCPECGKGEIQEKKSRKGKTFYSCSEYPDCKYAMPNPPVAEPCPDCGSAILMEKTTKKYGREKVCPNKECKFRTPYPEGDEEGASAEAAGESPQPVNAKASDS
ncbi:type I DNA topoisomerase [Thiohalorhabdus methylotrophus]|uniref:DNA topoisomerase 1 n=1 Tax=Thiohalorhabdus methylotrophus TaxID=3242694 RepID=A0ABV4TPR0_9GAMM